IRLADRIGRRLDLDDSVETPRPRHDAAIEPFGIIGRRDVDDLVDLVRAVEPLQEFAVAMDFDDGVDVLEEADNRPIRLDLPEKLHGPREQAGMIAEDSDVPRLDDAVHDLVNDGALAGSLRTIKQITTAMQVTVLGEELAEVPEMGDFVEDPRRQ